MVYSDKFSLGVVDLKHIELSTDEDKEYQLDAWAKFFTSTTWEEVIMIAENNPYIEAAAQTLYEANADEMTKRKCRARRDYYKQQNTTNKLLKELSDAVDQKQLELDQKMAQLEQKNAEIEQKDAEIEQKDAEIEQKDARIKELETLIAQQNN